MNSLTRRQKWLIAMGLLLFAAIKVAMLLWWQQEKGSSPSVQTLDCNVRSGCVLPNTDGAVFSMSAPISAQTPFNLTLRGIDVTQEVSVRFEMADMDMGFNRYRLMAAERAPNTLQALAVRLPVCVTQRTDYIAVLSTEQGQYKIHFNTD
ncbi:MAG: hypothetical protein KA498_07465 [Neisseriaceae bacterium]|nr:hypothetical protein [Neisseriaceae bacterium]